MSQSATILEIIWRMANLPAAWFRTIPFTFDCRQESAGGYTAVLYRGVEIRRPG